MKLEEGWWFPDHEDHLPKWLRNPKADVTLNGRKAYQGKKQLAALNNCRNFRTALDVGGHVGLWSYNLGFKFQHVYAFEPMETHRECFKQNVTHENVTLLPVALGAVAGSVKMVTEQGSSGNTRVGGEGDIPMVTLDSYAFENVDLIKIDCEGYELNVLRGAEATIARCQPTIIVEQKRDMAARFGAPILGAVDYLKMMGYRVVQELSGDYIMVT